MSNHCRCMDETDITRRSCAVERTELELSGLDPVKLEFMYAEDRRKLLLRAGLNPDKYDF